MASPETTLNEVRERLNKLEGQNRRLKQIGTVALIVAASLFLMGQASSKKTVEADEFILRDTSGKAAGRLFMKNGLAPMLALMGKTGKEQLILSVVGNQPFFVLNDQNGKERLTAAVNAQGPRIFLRDSDAKNRAALGIEGEDGLPRLILYDKEERSRITLGGSDADTHGLVLYDSNEPRARFLVSNSGPLVGLRDNDGFEATIGATVLVTPRTGETHKTSAASIVLFGKEKNVLWKAP